MNTDVLNDLRDAVIDEWEGFRTAEAEKIQPANTTPAKESTMTKDEADNLIDSLIYEAIESCLEMFAGPDTLTFNLVQKFGKGGLFAAEDIAELLKAYSRDAAYSIDRLASNVSTIAAKYKRWSNTLRCEANGQEDLKLVDEIFKPIRPSTSGMFDDLC